MPVLRYKSVLSTGVAPVLHQLTVEVQRERAHIDLCALGTWNHDSFAFLVFGTQGGIKCALLGYVRHWRKHAQGFIENCLNVVEPNNIRVRLPDTVNWIRSARDISRFDLPGAAPPAPPRGPLQVPFAVSLEILRVLRRQRKVRDHSFHVQQRAV